MKDFFTFYQNFKELKHPFLAFSLAHIIMIVLVILCIYSVFQYYTKKNEQQKETFQKGMAYYFLIEEACYTTWLLLNCHDQIWIQILPLELCSICVYVNACSVFFKKEYMRFFSAVVGLVAGSVAILYPANISGLYPLLSYRVINFYILHGAFILFALIQLQDRFLLSYVHIKKNTMMVCSMFSFAFVVNLCLHSQYMFVGVPPKISFIASLYHITGILFFLPVVLLIVTLLQYVVLYVLRRCYRVHI